MLHPNVRGRQIARIVETDSREAPTDEGIQESFVLDNNPINTEERIRQLFNLPYPTTSTLPINEFTHEGFIARAFPTLFPFGRADLNQEREKKVTIVEYFQFLMQYRDRRFVTDPRFRFFAQNMIMRHQTISTVGVYVNKAGSVPQDVCQIRFRLQNDPSSSN